MFDHVTIRVSDYEASKAFYTTVLAPLGFEPYVDDQLPGAEWGDFSIAADGRTTCCRSVDGRAGQRP